MFFVGTRAQAKVVRRALRNLAGYPARGVTVGPVKWDPPETCELDANGDPVAPVPGWTTEAVDDGYDDGTQVAIEIPDELVDKYAGRTVTVKGKTIAVPTRAQLMADESALPDTLKAVRAARREATILEPGARTRQL